MTPDTATRETKIDIEKIDATNCREREHHKERLGIQCRSCGEIIPDGGIYTSEQVAYWFVTPRPEKPSSTPPEETALWEAYGTVWLPEYEDAAFALLALQRGRGGALGKDDASTGRVINFDVEIAKATDRFEKLRDEGSAMLLEINRLGQIRKNVDMRAMLAESFPEVVPNSLAARLRDVFRS